MRSRTLGVGPVNPTDYILDEVAFGEGGGDPDKARKLYEEVKARMDGRRKS
jgi:hypothetical protein